MYFVRAKRIMFLQYVLKEDRKSLIHKFLMAQIEQPQAGDWWSLVAKDIEELKLNLSLFEIEVMSKEALKIKVKTAVSEEALKLELLIGSPE